MTKKERMAITQFSAHWGRYTDLQPYQQQWLEKHVSYEIYNRNKCIYDSEWNEKRVFYVISGLVGRVQDIVVPIKATKKNIKNPPEEKIIKRLLSVGTPGMALMSTDHLYTDTQSTGEIITLRRSEVLTIDYEAIHRFMIDDNSLDGMLYALGNKKKRLMVRLRQIDAITDLQARYVRFAEILPDILGVLNQTEIQNLLGISRRTISRAQHFYAKGVSKR